MEPVIYSNLWAMRLPWRHLQMAIVLAALVAFWCLCALRLVWPTDESPKRSQPLVAGGAQCLLSPGGRCGSEEFRAGYREAPRRF